jgi:ADP-ribose pyrophosphatase YjhB (NUDIX family)
VHVDEAVLARVRAQFGEPALLDWDANVSDRELAMITYNPSRRHDVTLFVFNGERLALIRKPHFPDGIWRTPGGGIKPDEDFVLGVQREAREELGVEIELDRYLVQARAVFRLADQAVPWQTHVLSATTPAEELAPLDTQEIAEARWGTAAELAGPIRERLLETGRALWRYRVALHDAALEALSSAAPRT